MSVSVRRGIKSAFVAAVVLVLWIVYCFQPPGLPEPVSEHFTLEGVTLIRPKISVQSDATITVRDGKLTSMNQRGGGDVLDEYRGMYVLPGFVDMHAHLPPDNVLKLTRHYGLLFLAHGVTTVRDAGDLDGTAVPAGRELVERGAPFPNLLSCGPFVSKDVAVWPNTLLISSPEEADSIVAEIASRGHQCIKAYEGLTPEIVAALTVSAEKSGLHVLAHVPVEYRLEQWGDVDVQHLFGVQPPDSLRGRSVLYRSADWDGVTAERIEELVQYVTENKIRNTPTVALLDHFLNYADFAEAAKRSSEYFPTLYPEVVWHPEHGLPVYRQIGAEELDLIRRVKPRKLSFLKRLSDAGAILHVGTDPGQPFSHPGIGYWQELRAFEAAGIEAEQVLAYATHVARTSLGDDRDMFGENAPAEFLIFAENPAESLDYLETLQAVVHNGRLYPRADLQAAIDDYLDHYESPLVSSIAHWAARRTVSGAASEFK